MCYTHTKIKKEKKKHKEADRTRCTYSNRKQMAGEITQLHTTFNIPTRVRLTEPCLQNFVVRFPMHTFVCNQRCRRPTNAPTTVPSFSAALPFPCLIRKRITELSLALHGGRNGMAGVIYNVKKRG